ncbi:CoA-binding protein [Aminithiophilus ramosus]|uniref:CoA-binding protein n=1 Tax=Aminithiophilus ramosus TaxID=3029084 RepID=A0A9Q7EY72_9BACT|nr:CoA-binding protein [Aminithiophilus ramosus]QTX31691.1 CoA-binding protein [Aminithiophilus ramosus]
MALSFDEIRDRYVCSPSTVAVVGASAKKERPVCGVMDYLQRAGFRLFPVNPAYAGLEILGETCRARLDELEEDVDIVAFFLDARHQAESLASLVSGEARPVAWFQPGAENGEGERTLRQSGFEVVSGLCLMQIHRAACR